MGKKKFINKKQAATFTLVYRESVEDDDHGLPSRIFTRLDGGSNFIPGFSPENSRPLQVLDERFEVGEESRFGDADSDCGNEAEVVRMPARRVKGGALLEHVRLELLELGFPDDGYDYLQHMRKIGAAGVGAAFVPASRGRSDYLRTDVKAYDASRVEVAESNTDAAVAAIQRVISSTKPIPNPAWKGVIDSDIMAALDSIDESQFDSNDELDDDFVVTANEDLQPGPSVRVKSSDRIVDGDETKIEDDEEGDTGIVRTSGTVSDRPERHLDEQFELLAMREYDDSDVGELDENDPLARGHAKISQFSSVLSEFLNCKTHFSNRYQTIDESSVNDLNVKARIVAANEVGTEFNNSITEVEECSAIGTSGRDFGSSSVQPLGLTYSSASDTEVVLVESDEDDGKWDCETIVSTLSNLDNHPGKISSPGGSKLRSRVLDSSKGNIIRLGGKQHLPLDFLAAKRANLKANDRQQSSLPQQPGSQRDDRPVRVAGPRAGETPVQRRIRKAIIKEERKVARESKKALKLCYVDESRRARHGAAVMGPSCIHLP